MTVKVGANQTMGRRIAVRDPAWWFYCLAILLLKLVLFAMDPSPRMFMGDSGSYLWTALSGWIPPDRSFLYGFLIRWISISAHSLTSLLILQAFFGAATAILLAFFCLRVFHIPRWLSYLAGVLCALDPLQLVWERYVMTETISLFIYAAILGFSFSYIERRRLWHLVCLQLLGVLAISFRISYLLVVQVNTILLPVIAFLPFFWAAFRKCAPRPENRGYIRTFGVHLTGSILLMLAFHFAYKELNGQLSGREPGYLYSSGFSILATWAPTLRSSDAPDPRLARIIAQGNQFHISDIHLRNSQLYSKGSLIDRWKAAETDPAAGDQIAKQTALHSLVHRPLGIFVLGAETFLDYFDFAQTRRQAKSDLGKADWPRPMTATMADRFRLAPPRKGDAKSYSLLQRYFIHAQPYYYVALFSPLLCAITFYFVRQGYVILLFVHSSVLLATDSLLSVTASVRYLQPLSFIAIMTIALLLPQSHTRRAAKPASVPL